MKKLTPEEIEYLNFISSYDKKTIYDSFYENYENVYKNLQIAKRSELIEKILE